MKIDEALRYVDEMYHNKYEVQYTREKGKTIINLGEKVELTDLEKASVILAREVASLRRKLQLKDNIIKEAIEYIKEIDDDEFIETEHYTELLDILNGSDKE